MLLLFGTRRHHLLGRRHATSPWLIGRAARPHIDSHQYSGRESGGDFKDVAIALIESALNERFGHGAAKAHMDRRGEARTACEDARLRIAHQMDSVRSDETAALDAGSFLRLYHDVKIILATRQDGESQPQEGNG